MSFRLLFLRVIFLLVFFVLLFFVGIFSGFVQGKSFYSEEELVKKFPKPSAQPSYLSNFANAEPEKYDGVFYAFGENGASQIGLFEQKPYSYTGNKNRILGNKIYFAHGNSLLEFDLSSNQTTKIHELLPSEAYIQIKHDESTNLFYLTIYNPTISQNQEFDQRLIRLNPQTGEVREIISFNPGIYSVIKHLFTVSDTDIIYTEGGDACGGGGEIYAVQNKNKVLIKQYGIGCLEGSRLLGADSVSNSLIMAEVQIRKDDVTKADTKRIFRKNIVDGSEQTIFTLAEDGFIEQEISDDKKKIIFKSDSKILSYDFLSGEVEEFPLADSWIKAGYLTVINKGDDYCLIADGYDAKSIVSYCLIAQSIETYNYGNYGLSSPQVFGYFNNQLILSAAQEKK